MQTFTKNNLLKYQIGRQNDVAWDDTTGSSTNTSNFTSLSEFDVQHEIENVEIGDAEGNRSSRIRIINGNKSYPVSGGGNVEVDKIGYPLYHMFGSATSTQDGSTGAYQHTFGVLNNVVLPSGTLFYSYDGDQSNTTTGYKRLKNYHNQTLSISQGDSDLTFGFTGWGTEEDNTENVSSTVSGFQVTSIEYLTSGLTRYTLNTTDLSSVSNGDILDTSTSLGIAKSSNIGKFVIVSVTDATNVVDVINNGRSNGTDDETGLTATGSTISVVQPASYSQTAYLLKRHSGMKVADTTGGLAAATEDGLRDLSIELDNNSVQIYEAVRSANPNIILAGAISGSISFTQLINTTRGARITEYRTGTDVTKVFRFLFQDTDTLLGTSTTYNPLLQITCEATGRAERVNQNTSDHLEYNWTLELSDEQDISIVLQNEVASYGS